MSEPTHGGDQDDKIQSTTEYVPEMVHGRNQNDHGGHGWKELSIGRYLCKLSIRSIKTSSLTIKVFYHLWTKSQKNEKQCI